MLIPFSKTFFSGKELQYISEVIAKAHLSGDGYFTKKCNLLLEQYSSSIKVLLTTSCTHALEMSAMLLDIKEGDEVIMPSFTFVSTANAFVLRGAKIKFVDIRPDTLNINESLIEAAITKKTKAVIPVHYAGVSCEMNVITELAKSYGLYVVEDAAQCVGASYNERPLGSIGNLGCYSFHDTKNISSGEGGCLLINDVTFMERAEIIREKGTNRSKFFRGEIDKYSWVDIGSSYLPSELNAAMLLAQLENIEKINNKRMDVWNKYYGSLSNLAQKGLIELPYIPDSCKHNAHIFYFKCENHDVKQKLFSFMKQNGVSVTSHFVPLHTSIAGLKYGEFVGDDKYTTFASERLIRLPMFCELADSDVDLICEKVNEFYA